MKKLILFIALAYIPLTNNAQNSIFDKFEDMEDVTTVVVTQEAFKLLAKFKAGGEEGEEYFDMVKGLTSFKVFTTENPSISSEMDQVISKYLKSTKLTELMRVKDKETNVKIYIREGKDEDHVSELLMFVNGAGKYTTDSPVKVESVIIALTGDIDLNKISKLTDAHISGSGEHLKNAKK
jgi:hypothetical protein